MRQVAGIHDAPPPHWVGDGFPVRTLLSHHAHGRHVSPFIMLDHAGPATFTPTEKRRGVGAHPHKGFETVTIVYDGEVEHRDSTGVGGVIGPGDVQWMTAGSGIVHQEYHSAAYARTGGPFEMVQLWINLPARDKSAKPAYQSLLDAEIPALELPGGAGTLRVIAGRYGKAKGPARSFTPIDIWDMRLGGGKSTALNVPDGHSLTLVVLSGTVEINGQDMAREGQTVLFESDGGEVRIEANDEVKLLVLSGEPIDEPVAAYGPFVMNTPEEINQAVRDYKAGKFGAMPDAPAA